MNKMTVAAALAALAVGDATSGDMTN